MEQEPSSVPKGEEIDAGRGRIFPCGQCGADMEFHIGDQRLKCPFCGAVKEIELAADAKVEEQDFQKALAKLAELRARPEEERQEHLEVRCESCYSTVLFDGTLTSGSCPYCGSPIQREKIHRGGFRLPVDAILPFHIQQRKAEEGLREWIRSRWFAPNDFKQVEIDEKFHGVYLPFWTIDALTFTKYRGERGDNYTVTVGTGKDRRTETRTRWTPAWGQFQRFFDDVVINATKNLPTKHIDALSPWPLKDCRPFTQEYLAGHFARTYDVELEQGFTQAKARVEAELQADCRRRIGGDQQRLHDMQVRYDAVTYKHLLLPVWMLAYQYKDKPYRVFVNAVTGEIQGDRPYSWIKITLAIVSAVAVIGTVFALAQG